MINTETFSLEKIEEGVLISFPSINNLKSTNQYILYFDTVAVLPENSGTSVVFRPSAGSYPVTGSANFIPKIFVQIKSVYRIQTRTLLRLVIKDTNNNIVHTDYKMLVGLPQSSVTVSGRLLVPTVGNTGPNGGSLVQISGSNQSTDAISVGDKIQGPGIPSTEQITIKSIVSNVVFELSKVIPLTSEASGTFTISRTIDCIDPQKISNQLTSTTYTILDKDNNWTYKVKDQIIAQFVVDDPANNQDLVVLLPIKNASLLASSDSAAPIPNAATIKAGGLLSLFT